MNQKTKNITIIAFSVFALSIMVFNIPVNPINEANALSVVIKTITTPSSTTSSASYFFLLNTVTGVLQKITVSTQTVSTLSSSAITPATFRGFRCTDLYCWELRASGTSFALIYAYSAIDGSLIGSKNQTGDFSGSSDIGLYDTTVIFARKCTAGDQGSSGAGDTDLAVFSISGLLLTGTPVQLTDCGANFTAISTSSQGVIGFRGGTSGTGALAVIVNGAAGGVDIFKYINLNQALSTLVNPNTCQVNLSGNTFSSASGKNIQFVAGTTNKFFMWLWDSSELNIDTSTTLCSLSSSIGLFTVNQQLGIAFDSTNHVWYTGGNTTSALSEVRQYNFTNNVATTTKIATYPINTQITTNPNAIAFFAESNTVVVLSNSRALFFIIGEGTGTTPNPNAEFCEIPANANVLICRLESDGGPGALTGTSTLLNQSGTNIICQVGVLVCTRDSDGNFIPTNTDTKTNGVGYLMTIVALGIMVGMLWVASRGDLTSIPTFIWFIGTVAVLAMATAFQYIDPSFLVIGVLAIAAFAVAKARNMFGGIGLFPGESG